MIRVEKAQGGQRLEDVCASSCLLNQRFRVLVVPERLPPDLARCGSGRGPGRGGARRLRPGLYGILCQEPGLGIISNYPSLRSFTQGRRPHAEG